MFGSTFETVGILGGIALIVVVILTLILAPSVTVVIYSVLAWINVLITIMLCDPFNKSSSR